MLLDSHDRRTIRDGMKHLLLDNAIEVRFADGNGTGIFSREDQDFISVITRQNQQLIANIA
jgi:hypothetical protein